MQHDAVSVPNCNKYNKWRHMGPRWRRRTARRSELLESLDTSREICVDFMMLNIIWISMDDRRCQFSIDRVEINASSFEILESFWIPYRYFPVDLRAKLQWLFFPNGLLPQFTEFTEFTEFTGLLVEPLKTMALPSMASLSLCNFTSFPLSPKKTAQSR